MNITATNSWYKANSHYLMSAAAGVHRLLERHIAIKQNQPSELVREDEVDLKAIASSMPNPPALAQVCNTFNLSPFECDILLLCVGMAIFPNFTSLCANAHGNREMTYPTFGLALEVFPNAHWSAFTPQAPLRHWQLLQVGTGQVITLGSLQIDESILHYLFGEPYQDQRLMSLMLPMPEIAQAGISLQQSHQQLAERLAATLKNGDRRFSVSVAGRSPEGVGSREWRMGEGGGKQNSKPTHPIVQLCGLEIADKSNIAAVACGILGCPLQVMSANRLPTDADELNHLMRRWERAVALTNSVLLLNCEQVNSADTLRQTAILQLVQETKTPLIITTEERLHSPQRPLISFDVPQLTHSEQRAIWQSNLGSIADELNGHIETLVSQFNLSTLAIQSACLEAISQESETENPQLPTPNSKLPTPHSALRKALSTTLWDTCRTMARPRLDDLAQRIDATATWEELVLPEQQRQILRDVATHVRQRAVVYQSWGFAGKGSRGLGISALFSGASGTGKTMAAEVLAHELQLDLYRIDLSAVVSKYIGETEKNLRRIFDAAEAGGAILLFDEADALFGKRSEVKDSHDRHANVEVSYLLQRMEAYQGLAILTTNLKGSLDQAFLRRIRFVVSVPFPDAKARAEIWRHIFPKQTPTQDLDMDKLAKLNVAGGNIRNIALNAAFLAADAGESVMMKHILKAARSEYLKLERALTDFEVKGWV
jgi:hypothetical protein